ncbi:8687_t:CDS:1, partial [Scutellospora calospora]
LGNVCKIGYFFQILEDPQELVKWCEREYKKLEGKKLRLSGGDSIKQEVF